MKEFYGISFEDYRRLQKLVHAVVYPEAFKRGYTGLGAQTMRPS